MESVYVSVCKCVYVCVCVCLCVKRHKPCRVLAAR